MYDLMKYGIAISFFNTTARCICKVNLPAEYRLSILYLPIYLIGKRNAPYKYVIYGCMYSYDWKLKLPFWLERNICISQILLTLLSCFLLTNFEGKKRREPTNEASPFHVCQGCGKIFPTREKFIIRCKYIYPFMIWISSMKIWIGS